MGTVVGEIRLFAFPLPFTGWMPCDGRPLPVAGNQALFSVIGVTYGGDGKTTFNLPDLRGRVPVHAGTTYAVGTQGGADTVTLATSQMPQHTHSVMASTATAGAFDNPSGVFIGAGPGLFAPPNSPIATNPAAVGSSGAGAAHENRQPFLTLNFCIATQGEIP